MQGFTSYTKLAYGKNHGCSINTGSGTSPIYCTGENTSGQLGGGHQNNLINPVAISGLNNAFMISAGESHTCAYTQNEDILCWGNNSLKQAGAATGTTFLRPNFMTGLPW